MGVSVSTYTQRSLAWLHIFANRERAMKGKDFPFFGKFNFVN